MGILRSISENQFSFLPICSQLVLVDCEIIEDRRIVAKKVGRYLFISFHHPLSHLFLLFPHTYILSSPDTGALDSFTLLWIPAALMGHTSASQPSIQQILTEHYNLLGTVLGMERR